MSRSLKHKFLHCTAWMAIAMGSVHAYEGPIQLTWSADDAPTSSSAKAVDESSCNWAQGVADALVEKSAGKVQTGAEVVGKKYDLRVTPTVALGDPSASRPKAFFKWTGELLEGATVINRFEFKEDEKLSSLKTCADFKGVIKDFVGNTTQWLTLPRHKLKIASELKMASSDAIDPMDYRESCGKEATDVAALIQKNIPDWVEVVEAEAFKNTQSQRLQMTALGGKFAGGSMFSGRKWLELKGEIFDGERLIGSFVAKQGTSASLGGMRNWGLCKPMETVFSDIAKDIAKWIKNPTVDARLGDAK